MSAERPERPETVAEFLAWTEQLLAPLSPAERVEVLEMMLDQVHARMAEMARRR